jgi:hypothetical protein
MNYYIATIFSFTIVIAAIIGWIRYAKMDPAFYPFLFLVSIATINEVISFIVIQHRQSNALNANIYSLLESILICWQFKKWKFFSRNETLFYILVSLLTAMWLFENFYLSSIFSFDSYFNITYGLMICFMSVRLINQMVLVDKTNLQSNPIFLICFCFSVFYMYSSLIEIYWIWGLGGSKSFRLNIYRIFSYINLFSNLTYAIAMLWIPRKRKFMVLL